MADNSRKRSRKSKLVPRDCVDLVEDDLQLQEPHQKKLLLEKIKKEPEDYIPHSYCPTSHKFSVEVEIEDMDTSAPDEDAPDYMKYLFSLSKESEETPKAPEIMDFADNSLLLEQKLVIPVNEEDNTCIVDIKKLQNMLATLHKKYPKEKEVVMHCRNQWGRAFHERCPTEIRRSPLEMSLHDVLRRWKEWTMLKRAKESPYSYKCYICDTGWWTYTEFTNHVIQHKNCLFQIETRNLECDIVAYKGQAPRVVKDVEIHGKCTKCAKTYAHHLTNKRVADGFYYCNYCEERFQTCRTLTKHEGSCPRNPIRVLATTKSGKDYSFTDFTCNICQTVFLSNPDLEEHLIICHKVRSDEPIATMFKTCNNCEQNYYNFFFHVCSKKNYITECQHCSRMFQNKQMLDFHFQMWHDVEQCKICNKYLLKSCMAAEHYALHSEEFLLAHRCLVCRKIKVFATEEAQKNHYTKYHKRHDTRRPRSDRIIMPRIMLEQCLVEPVKKSKSINAPKTVPKAGPSRAMKTEDIKPTREESMPRVRVYVPVHIKNSKETSNAESYVNNTTISHDDTVTMRPEILLEEPLVQVKQEKEDTTGDLQIEILEKNIKIEKMDIEEEKISAETNADNKEIEDKKDRKNLSSVMTELTEFLDIKPEIIKEEKFSDDEATHATQELESLLKISHTESDITKVFQASTTFAEEVTDRSEHSSVFEISKTILEADIKQEKEPEAVKSPTASPDQESSIISETSDISALNLEPEVILKAGYRKRKIYKCNKCDFSGFHREYKQHINNHCDQYLPKAATADVNYKCTKCDRGFQTLKKYALHFEKHGYRYMSCAQCSLQFESVTKLMPHLNGHMKAQFFKLQVINSCDDSSEKTYQCKNCSEVVNTRNWFEHWEKHLVLQEPAAEDQAGNKHGDKWDTPLNQGSLKEVLEVLTKQFTNESRHARACCVCSRVFERKNDTKRHLIEHLLEDAYANIVTTKTLKCQICNESYKKADAYKKHMRDHANLPIYKCGLCNKTFSDSSNFTKHKKLHNLKAYICDICSKKFQAKGSLEKHMQMHMETEPITCTECERVFYDRSFYKRHYRQYHERIIFKYKCVLCREKFTTIREKWDHLWDVHKQRKEPADCPICGVSYRKFIDVKKHAYLKHGESITLSSLWSLLSKVKYNGKKTDGNGEERGGEVGEGSNVNVKEEVSSDDDCLLIEEEPETLVVYD